MPESDSHSRKTGQDLVEQVTELGLALQGIDRELGSGQVPVTVLEDFRTAVDHTRMTLWAVITAADAGELSVITAAIVRYRLGRMIEMCRRSVADMDSGALTLETPELPIFRAILEQTLERIEELEKSAG
ncbi:MAG: hypothetical protein ACRD4D_03705 [Candidatus Acidiferrales bacterium]